MTSPPLAIISLPAGIPAARDFRLAALSVAVLLSLWATCVWIMLRPPDLAADWHGWRQTDTQTIALNFTRPDSSIFWPQINWGGDGPGYVETEFQLYAKLVASLMAVVGRVEWAGQLVSLLAIVATAAMVFVHTSRRYHPIAGAVAVGAFLAVRTSPHLATVIMPDAVALLAYVTAWTFFWRYAEDGRGRDLLLYGVAGALAMLTKPTTAHLGISSFLLLALANRARLRDYRVWLMWAAMVGVLVAYLAHAHVLYVQYGNTFGLLVGEDSKAPHLRYLLMPRLYVQAARLGVAWGLTGLGAAIVLGQLLRRRLDAEHLALAVGNIAIVFIALRYMSEGAGIHYYAPASLLAACAAASLAADVLNTRRRVVLMSMLSFVIAVQAWRSMEIRLFNARFFAADPTIASVIVTGHEIDRLTEPGDLIVVRSPNLAYDTFWQQAANFHDPRIFYLAQTRGWTLGREQDDVRLLESWANKGAKYFADPVIEPSVALEAWLSTHAQLVWTGPAGGHVWQLRSVQRLASAAWGR